MIVDVHAHYYPREYLERIGHPELPLASAAYLRDQPIEERLALLDRLGIDAQVLSVSQAQPYLAAGADAAAAARLGNDLFVQLCEQYPGRFFTFAALPLPHVNETLDELARVSEQRYVVGVTIGCTIAGMHIDDPRLEPVFQELERRRARVFLHPVGECCVVDGQDYNFDWLVGAPFEDTLAALRLALSGTADRFAGIEFIVPHLGGTLPLLLGRVLRMTAGRGEAALRRMYYDTVSDSAEAIQFASQFWGPERLLFGTDYPYSDEDEFERRLTLLSQRIGPEHLDKVRGGRAASLLGIDRQLVGR